MTKKRFNWSLAVVLLVAGTIFVSTILIVRRWQQNAQSRHETAAVTSVVR